MPVLAWVDAALSHILNLSSIKIAIGNGDLINVRFSPLCGLKADISEIRDVPLAS